MTPFVYICRDFRVVDGDTVDCHLDLGFRTFHDVYIRLEGINTPEPRGREKVAGKAVSGIVERLFDEYEGDVLCRSTKLDKFGGRAIGDFQLVTNGLLIPSLADFLLNHGLAHRYGGGPKQRFDDDAIKDVISNAKAFRVKYFGELDQQELFDGG